MKKNRSMFFIIISIVTSLLSLYTLVSVGVIPNKFLLIIVLSIGIFNLSLIIYAWKSKSVLSNVLLLLFSISMIVIVPYSNKLDSVLQKITNNGLEKHTVLVLVKLDSEHESIDDLVDLPFGANTHLDEYSVDQAVSLIEEETDFKVHVQRYSDFDSLYDDFITSVHEAVIIKEDHIEMMTSIDEDFEEKVRVVASYTYELELESNTETNTSTDTFSIYVSGLDFSGDISGSGRSDANIVLTINPVLNQVLMTSIPRDTFVVRADNGEMDKLSYVGLSGMDNTVKTIENLIGMDIDYTLRVNWDSVVNIVDALGGIDVDSEFDFVTKTHRFSKGINHLDGKAALAFVNNRKALAGGDESRVYNQQAVLKAIIDKMLSPSIITNYHAFLDAASDSVVLNMPNNELNRLIRSQIESMKPWEIHSMQVIGDVFDTYDCFSMMGKFQTVKTLRPELLEQAQTLIELMENNEPITSEMFK